MSSRHHSRVEANNVDPDEGKSWLCSACKLPIFATPFIGGGAALLHDQCSDLPVELKHNELHREKPMLLIDNEQSASCSRCSQKCGSKMYHCPDPDCGLILDVACALPIKILHWSHPHRLQPIRGNSALLSFIICGVCCATHQAGAAAAAAAATSYFCSVCGFWIHPECAALSRVIEHEKHEHPLVLYYDVEATFGADESNATIDVIVGDISKSSTAALPQNTERCICAICQNDVARRCGIYSCLTCRDYFIHVNCATSHLQTFKSVSIGEARFPSLVRLPIEDEHRSFVGYAREAKDTNTINVGWSLEKVHGKIVHKKEHPFTLHDQEDYQDLTRCDDDDEDPSHHRVCNACIKIISTPPFYSCSLCPSFFLHDYCSRLPTILSTISTHISGHQFASIPFPAFPDAICGHCRCRFTGSSYSCMHAQCFGALFVLDASCALMPSVITHDAHSAAHFLRLTDEANSSSRDRGCDCCSRPLGKLAYECRTCPNFALHTWCAMLPRTVTHKFDTHPLTLTTTTSAAIDVEMMICEICENRIESGVWNYSCTKCEQSFHIDCIPCLDLMYKIKALASCGYDRVPTRLIRGLALQGHGHDYCSDVADEYDILQSY